MNPAEWLKRTATRFPDRPALYSGETLVSTYAGFDRAAASIGAALRLRGIGAGHSVAVFMYNCPEFLETLYGIWYAGAAAVPINAKLHPKEAAWIIDDAGADLVFSDDALIGDLSDLLEGRGIISVNGGLFAEMKQAYPMPAPVGLNESDLLWLFYTSGTTGKPKGVALTCGNIAAMTFAYFTDVDDVFAEDAILYAAPMSHGAGLYNFMHVMRGARHLVPESGGFDAAEILMLGKRMGPISMFAAPTMVRRLVDAAKASSEMGEGLRTIVYAGGPMYEADILDATEVMGARFV
ncbi:MAG: long-chain fatty acid--CoA ligase, partial [Rhodobacteraceae bacterium]|nr:long-chain fatty acid--CoA ligase [Paracoccaceae bacterium]